ncbi:nucleotidyltransferase family protein [Modestobacter sp. VKM Ac-2977]|uniref:nucleotidyltransferase family protein n=1 Tax=Modestobacter sp. VKM Ac-2977 TaxID=3004131 RepID=UPI0022AB0DE1|nr:nucleotidyltransferase family protein [Modestobacter sp. VKM Ac-2977]MCZ2819980.1 nucleotidyltransferase family protein [Modestobacter sp. VKM Ac-2977]
MAGADESRFLELVLANPTVSAVLERAPALGLPDAWLTAGVLFQSVWNGLTGRVPAAGIRDADFFYFDPDTSWAAEDAVIRRGAELFGDLPIPVEMRNEARVHLWYADRFGAPTPAPFRDCRDAIDAFAAVCCSVGVSVGGDGELRVYAPYGYDDLFGMVVRPNPGLAPQSVYEAKAARWLTEWPQLTVLPWNTTGPRGADG